MLCPIPALFGCKPPDDQFVVQVPKCQDIEVDSSQCQWCYDLLVDGYSVAYNGFLIPNSTVSFHRPVVQEPTIKWNNYLQIKVKQLPECNEQMKKVSSGGLTVEIGKHRCKILQVEGDEYDCTFDKNIEVVNPLITVKYDNQTIYQGQATTIGYQSRDNSGHMSLVLLTVLIPVSFVLVIAVGVLIFCMCRIGKCRVSEEPIQPFETKSNPNYYSRHFSHA